MRKIIRIATEIEPAELHGEKSGEVFGAHLALEVQDSNESDAKAEFEAFLNGLPAGSFHLISITKTTHEAEIVGKLQSFLTTTKPRAGEIFDWLVDCKGQFQDLARREDIEFFNTSAARGAADMRNARAVDLLRATAKWPAPLAQKNGLTVALASAFTRDTDHVYAVLYLQPGLKAADVKLTADDPVDSQVVVTVSWSPPEGDDDQFRLVSGIIQDYSPPGNLFEKDGRFRTLTDSDALMRLTSRIEELSPSQLSIASVLEAIGSSQDMVRNIAGVGGEGQLPDETPLPAAACRWLQRAATATLFDIPLIALRYPAPHNDPLQPAQRRNSVLQRLSRSIASYFEQLDLSLDVNETALYKNLHSALDSRLGTLSEPGMPGDLTLPKLWDSLKSTFPDHNRLKQIETALTGVENETNPIPATWRTWRDSMEQFAVELSQLSVFLESESGLESWLLDLCDQAFLDGSTFDQQLLAGTNIPTHTFETVDMTSETIKDRSTEIYLQFRAGIEGEFNAAEALRRDFGALIIAELDKAAASAAKGGLEDAGEIALHLENSDWFSRRVFAATPPAQELDSLIAPCIAVPLPQGIPELEAVAKKHLISGFVKRSHEIIGKTEAAKLFSPDLSPKPLPIRITDTIAPADIDKASARISGLGFMVRAVARDSNKVISDETLHASLVRLTERTSGTAVVMDPTVLPTLPVLNNGNAGIFISYEGAPVSTPNRPRPAQGGADLTPEQRAQAQAAETTRGYQLHEATYKALPALAYGRSYAVSAFWVPGSGALPVAVRSDPNDSFKPGGETGSFAPPDDALVAYLRRTAIAGMDVLAERSDVRRFEVPDGVQPLAHADPRLVLERIEGGHMHIDLFRLADGTGGLNSELGPIVLSDVAFSGVTDKDLKVQQFRVLDGELDADDADVELEKDVEVVPGERQDNLKITPKDWGNSHFWLRLSWREQANGPGCMSFSDPAHEERQSSADRANQVLLLASKEEYWTVGTTKTVTIQTPRVSYSDFECWARNKELWRQATDGQRGADDLFTALRWAQAFFEEFGDPYAEKIKKLPDPAVRAIFVSAALSDQVFGERDTAQSCNTLVEISPYTPVGLNIPTKFNVGEGDDVDKTIIAPLHELIDEIAKRASINLVIEPGSGLSATGTGSTRTLTVTESWIACVRACAAVDTAHFAAHDKGGVFHERMRELAIGHLDKWTLFDGAKFHVEVMTPLPKELSGDPLKRLATATNGTERAYSLDFRPQRNDRIFAVAQLATQQWRPTGQPIYRWINPVPGGLRAPKPVVEVIAINGLNKLLAENKAGPAVGQVDFDDLQEFETDAYFGLPDEGGTLETKLKLTPYPAVTRLRTFAWPEQSATYYRHQVLLYSRYAGAIANEADRFLPIKAADLWAARTAMLAAPVAERISRPQVRAYHPVQRGLQLNSTIPPIGCVLAEPPFSQLGLADRVDADLKTIDVFTIETNGDHDMLRLDQLRKQIGADPLLCYYRVPDDASRQSTLRAEGPVGLHFDTEGTRSPAYSNCQFMLHIEAGNAGPAIPEEPAATSEELEECFVGVLLSRYSDPGWTWMADQPDGQEPEPHKEDNTTLQKVGLLPDFDASWIDLDGDLTLKPLLKQDENDLKPAMPAPESIVQVDKQQDEYSIKIAKEALFHDGGAGYAELCRVNSHKATVSLLIRPMGDARYLLSVHRFGNANPSKKEVAGLGTIGRPQLVASVILKVPLIKIPVNGNGQENSAQGAGNGTNQKGSADEAAKSKAPIKLVLEPPMCVRRTCQTNASIVEWVRTTRDMTKWMKRRAASPNEKAVAIEISRLTPVLPKDGGQLKFTNGGEGPLHLVSPVSTHPYPLHVHRHLALIVRKPSTEIGHQIDLFDQTLLSDGTGSAYLKAGAGSSIVIAEIQNRAEILYVQDPGPRPDIDGFRAAHFDLKSSRDARKIQQLRLHFRAVTKPVDLNRLEFELRPKNPGQNQDGKITITPATDLTAETRVNGFDIFLYHEVRDKGAEQYRYDIRWPRTEYDGVADQAQIHAKKAANLDRLFDDSLEAFDLIVRDPHGADGERWFDISMLHSAKFRGSAEAPALDSFDFDWLFGAPKWIDALPKALEPKTLNALPEAQALLVGFSDPIAIRLD